MGFLVALDSDGLKPQIEVNGRKRKEPEKKGKNRKEKEGNGN